MKIGLGYVPESHRMNDVVATRISFKPFINYVENRLKTEKTAKARLYRHVLDEFRKSPASEGNINVDEIDQYAYLLELIYAILSPFTADEHEYLWAMSAPASKYLFYGTEAYVKLIESENSAEVESKFINNEKGFVKKRFKKFVYKLILDKYYDLEPINRERIIYSHYDRATGLIRYYEAIPDSRFIEIIHNKKLPPLPNDPPGMYVQNGEVTRELRKILPLSSFSLEGFTVINLKDITEEYAVEIIKKALISHSQNEDILFEQVRHGLKLLGGCPGIEFGLLPFLSVNGNLVFDDVDCSKSVMISAARRSDRNMASVYTSAEAYLRNPETIVYPAIGEEERINSPHIYALAASGVKSYAAVPVYHNKGLVGILEVYSRQHDVQYEYTLSHLNRALPFIAQLLQNSIEQFNTQINRVIWDRFTAIRPAVQWKFNEVAYEYYRQLRIKKKNPVMGTVSFHNVHPLYGMVDIRDSTLERNNALGKDIKKLLHLLHTEETNICALVDERTAPKVEEEFAKWNLTINRFSTTGDSGLLNLFIQTEVVTWLRGLAKDNPEAKAPACHLKRILEQDGPEISANRNRLETAMQKINSGLNSMFAREYKVLMEIYPCYFETFRTDGIEYDLYVGQSISPGNRFLPRHLEIFRIWQLKSMIKAAGITKKALTERDWQLTTTQLIYVNPLAINISFRNDERHFDVDGSYNIRYQVVKKRIDKVHIKDTVERLTQPGKIAIVYYNDSDVATYLENIKTLQEENLLSEEIEKVELEDLQGIYGLKAIRVTIK